MTNESKKLQASLQITLSMAAYIVFFLIWAFVITISTDGGDYTYFDNGAYGIILPSLILLIISLAASIVSMDKNRFELVAKFSLLSPCLLLVSWPFLLWRLILYLISFTFFVYWYLLFRSLRQEKY